MYRQVAFLLLVGGIASSSIIQGNNKLDTSASSLSITKKAQSVVPYGVVEPITRCGGVGTFHQLRISDCSGRCQLTPGRVHSIEVDFSPCKLKFTQDFRLVLQIHILNYLQLGHLHHFF
jgi:hypothetical protein